MRLSTPSQYSQREARHGLIPGGAHTYSRGDDTFPINAPELLSRGKGSKVYSLEGRKYIDWAMSLRSVVLGHSYPPVNRAVVRASRIGNNLARPVIEEFLLAEMLQSLIPSAEMVKFGKNGSDATVAAVRLARAATGKSLVLRSSADSFLGVHDWFIGSTLVNRGIPQQVKDLTRTFSFGSLESLEEALREGQGDVAAIIMEPAGAIIPSREFLMGAKALSKDYGAVLIFDETVSGFRVSQSGAQGYFGVTPDLSTFGKALANGYPLSALVGRKDLMELGGIDHQWERVFLMSSTYGSERTGLLAGLATVRTFRTKAVVDHLWKIGNEIKRGLTESIESLGLKDSVVVGGLPCSPTLEFLNSDGSSNLVCKTIFMERLFDAGHFVSSNLFSPAFAHSRREVRALLAAAHRSLTAVLQAQKSEDASDFLYGRPIRPVFRKFN